jgi:hypothetical protein
VTLRRSLQRGSRALEYAAWGIACLCCGVEGVPNAITHACLPIITPPRPHLLTTFASDSNSENIRVSILFIGHNNLFPNFVSRSKSAVMLPSVIPARIFQRSVT